jgi:hypothetical protein
LRSKEPSSHDPDVKQQALHFGTLQALTAMTARAMCAI